MPVSFISRARRSIALAAVAAVLVPALAAAQTPLNVSVTVNTALSVSVDQALLFGTLVPGQLKTITANDESVGGAGIYRVTGTVGANVNLSVTFPACLKVAPGACVPASDPAIDNTQAQWAGAMGGIHTALPGAGTHAGTGVVGGAGNLFVFVGARVTIPVGAADGTYSGNVTLTASY